MGPFPILASEIQGRDSGPLLEVRIWLREGSLGRPWAAPFQILPCSLCFPHTSFLAGLQLAKLNFAPAPLHLPFSLLGASFPHPHPLLCPTFIQPAPGASSQQADSLHPLLDQGWADCSLRAKSCLLSFFFFFNKVLLEPSHTHSSAFCPSLLSDSDSSIRSV